MRQYRLLAHEAVLQLRADRAIVPPYGLFGGGPAAPSRNVLNPDDENQQLPSKVTRTLRAGEVIRHEQAGGGGYGDPFSRNPYLVAADVVDEKITPDFAEEKFGVVMGPSGATPDLAATALMRRQRTPE